MLNRLLHALSSPEPQERFPLIAGAWETESRRSLIGCQNHHFQAARTFSADASG